MLALVLWLGNISFLVFDSENHVEVENDGVRNVAKLLGCSVLELMTTLSTYKIHARYQGIVQKKYMKIYLIGW